MRRSGLIVTTALFAAVILSMSILVFRGLDSFGTDSSDQRIGALREAVVRSAAECYALEGSYPQGVEYLERHYGLQVDRKNFIVHYVYNGANIAPDIMVLQAVG